MADGATSGRSRPHYATLAIEVAGGLLAATACALVVLDGLLILTLPGPITGLAGAAGAACLAAIVIVRSRRHLRRLLADAAAAAVRSEGAHAALLAVAQDALVTIDGDGLVIAMNARAEAMFGVAARDAIGASIQELVVPPQLREHHADAFAATAGGRAGEVPPRVRITAMRAGGSEFPADVTVTHESDGSTMVCIRDRADIRRVDQQLEASEARFKDIATASSDWIWETDPTGRLLFLSDRYGEIVGIDPREHLGATLQQLCVADVNDKADELPAIEQALTARRPFRDLRCRIRVGGQRTKHIRLSGIPAQDNRGRFTGYRGTGSDVTPEVNAAARLRYQAEHDALTGLANRVGFANALGAVMAGGRNQARAATVFCMDLDHFKEVNDSFGHDVGDEVLRQAARRLREVAREDEVLARLGGDEFVLMIPRPLDLARLTPVCQRLIEAMAAPFVVGGRTLHLGLSIGVSRAPADARDTRMLMKNADVALYRAKHEGRGQWRLYHPSMGAELQARRQLENELRTAIERDELKVHFQPQVALATETVGAVEALVRWIRPNGIAIPPVDFIPLAEQNGMIGEIGTFVLREACRQSLLWPAITLSVNLSPIQLRAGNLIEIVTDVLADTGFPADRLELEITESALLSGDQATRRLLDRLKALGIRLAMDDFGTGYSSLSYLSRFPFDKIKLDRSFIRDLETDSRAPSIVSAVLSLAKNLDLTVTAEGVETVAQADFLTAGGCTYAQGYLYSRPVASSALTSLVQAEPSMPRRPRETRQATPARGTPITLRSFDNLDLRELLRPAGGLAGAQDPRQGGVAAPPATAFDAAA